MDLIMSIIVILYIVSIGIFILTFYNSLQISDPKDIYKHVIFGVAIMSIVFYDMFKVLFFDESECPKLYNCPLCGHELPSIKKYDVSDPTNPFHCSEK